jgi:hypothetical protein
MGFDLEVCDVQVVLKLALQSAQGARHRSVHLAVTHPNYYAAD